MEHNDSEKQQLILKEYGKNIQQLVQHVEIGRAHV